MFEAMRERRTSRVFDARALPMQILANLLWSAFGVNRRIGPLGFTGRTAASAGNAQEIDIYLSIAQGAYRYDPGVDAMGPARLIPVAEGDVRAGALPTVERWRKMIAPAQLIYVADQRRLLRGAAVHDPRLSDPLVRFAEYGLDVGLIAQNVFLFAAAHGLAAWLHACDSTDISAWLSLRPDQRPLYAQSVGFPDAGGGHGGLNG